MKTEFFVFLGFYIAGLIIRTCYELLKKAGKVDKVSKPVFVLIFAAMCLMWTGWFDMCSQDPWRITMPGALRLIGLGAFIFGLILALGSLIQLKGLENIKHLVTTGLFSKIRHPMYLGFILWILGWALYHGAIISLTAGFVGIGNILYWQRMEEAALEEQFEEDYRKYRTRTWF